jgi:diguanylate cyclase (GGDEF)-like protein
MRAVGGKRKASPEELYGAYGPQLHALLPDALEVALLGPDQKIAWQRTMQSTPCSGATLKALSRGTGGVARGVHLVPNVLAVIVPVPLDTRRTATLCALMPCPAGRGENSVLTQTVAVVAPTLDCLRREAEQSVRRERPNATLGERQEEIEWLLNTTKDLHASSDDAQAVDHLLGALVERLKCCFGAAQIPEHDIDITYHSRVHLDLTAPGSFARSRECFAAYVRRHRSPLCSNKVLDATLMPPFKILLLPVGAQAARPGYLVFYKSASRPNFSRRQLFLARQAAHRIGALLESPYDHATGLLTRVTFEQDATQLLGTASGPHSLLHLNVDRLRQINERMGFEAGDAAIVSVADLLRPPALPERFLCCRLSGDSFIVLLPECRAGPALEIAARLVTLAAERTLGSARLSISVSCGVSAFIQSTDLRSALAQAVSACARAKAQGGKAASLYQPEATDGSARAHFDASALRQALAENRFCLYGQKIVSTAMSGRLRGIECLVRLRGADGLVLSPCDFLPSAQRCQLLPALDDWVVSRVFEDLKDHRLVLEDLNINVSLNVSGQSIQDEHFVDTLETCLKRAAIAPVRLLLEISETAAIANLERANRLIRRLRDLGCGVALDDFGIAVNSLSYLRFLAVSCVKLDARLTRDLAETPASVELQAILQLCQGQNIECIAECVENPMLCARLQALGVHSVQGFALHRPEPLSNLLQALARESVNPAHAQVGK